MTDELITRAEDILAHAGVKGMKWGHRKPDDDSSDKNSPNKYKKAAVILGSAAVAGAIIAGDGYFKRYGERSEKVAATFYDPPGRKDFSGRTISHNVMIPEHLAKGINNHEDAVKVAWPLLKNMYDVLYEISKS